jgi:hypothetical protein
MKSPVLAAPLVPKIHDEVLREGREKGPRVREQRQRWCLRHDQADAPVLLKEMLKPLLFLRCDKMSATPQVIWPYLWPVWCFLRGGGEGPRAAGDSCEGTRVYCTAEGMGGAGSKGASSACPPTMRGSPAMRGHRVPLSPPAWPSIVGSSNGLSCTTTSEAGVPRGRMCGRNSVGNLS